MRCAHHTIFWCDYCYKWFTLNLVWTTHLLVYSVDLVNIGRRRRGRSHTHGTCAGHGSPHVNQLTVSMSETLKKRSKEKPVSPLTHSKQLVKTKKSVMWPVVGYFWGKTTFLGYCLKTYGGLTGNGVRPGQVMPMLKKMTTDNNGHLWKRRVTDVLWWS